MITTDIFSDIGSSHRTCEDYIIKGDDPVPYIILSDGCSTSKDTEMGARFLCHLAKQYLKYRQHVLEFDYHKMGSWIIHNAELTARQLGLSAKCLNSTLIIALQLDDVIKVFMYGDGTIVRQGQNSIDMLTVDFQPVNAPYYLAYKIDQEGNEFYHKLKNDLVVNSDSVQRTFAYDYPTTFTFLIEELDTLLICSDGISSFLVDNHNQRSIIPASDIIPDFIAFKNTKGEFLKRRVGKALKNLLKNGITHFDDLSIGAFLSTKED